MHSTWLIQGVHHFALALILACLATSGMGCQAEDSAEPAIPDTSIPEVLRGKIQIVIPDQRLQFSLKEVAQGVTLNYEIVVTQSIENVLPKPQDTGAGAGAGPSGLYPFESIAGNDQSYSLQDIGLGPGVRDPRTIKKGRFPLSVHWDGRNWTGPSDYGHPKGPPFPAGEYTFTVRLVGTVKTPAGKEPYDIRKSVTLTLTD